MARKVAVLLLFLLTSFAMPAIAFTLQVRLSEEVEGKMVLTLYTTDSVQNEMTCRMRDGLFTFEGNVEQATFAELRHTAVEEPLLLFVDESDIRVQFNISNPSQSPVTGSRANSMYRYQLEQWQENADSVSAFVAAHRQAPQAAFLVERYLLHKGANEEGKSVDLTLLHRLVDSLQAPATFTWHYRHLTQSLRRLDSLATGAYLPEFVYADKEGKLVKFDSVAHKNYRVVLVGATWCRQCDEAILTLSETVPQLKVLRIDLDRHPKGWDAPFISQLAVEHIPYIILLDKEGRIVVRDIRAWQIQTYVK